MQRRFITVILFALVAALASSTVLYKIISANSARTVKAPTTQVCVAARNLDAGTLVSDADLKVVEWPVTAGSQWISRREDVVGRSLSAPVTKDEPIAENRLAEKGSGAGLSSRIPPGMRAVPIHVDEASGLTRYVQPGAHVDVISTSNAGTAATRTILQNIEVFSGGPGVDRDSKERPVAVQSVNLLVTPQQAEILSQAVAQTRIQLVLRNPLDNGNFLSSLLPSLALSGDSAMPRVPRAAPAVRPVPKAPAPVAFRSAPVAAPAAPAPPTVEVIHGTKKVVSVVGASEQGPAQ